jgi:Icc-related predicted phosphoesterase
MINLKKKKVLIVGDVHGNYDLLFELYKDKNPDIILQCGDFGYFPKFDHVSKEYEILHRIKVPLYFCDGNHDDHDSLRGLNGDGLYGYSNIRYVKRGDCIAINGENILFMGGAHSTDYHMRTIGYDWWPEEIIQYKNMQNLPTIKVNIIISHTCPNEFITDESGSPIKSIYLDSDPSREALSQLLENYNPERWFFGHWHCYAESKYKDTYWKCLNKVDRCNGDILQENNCWCWLD